MTGGSGQRVGTIVRAVITGVAVLLVWAALVAPDRASAMSPTALLRVPVEGVLLLALALVLPWRVGRVLAATAGALLGVVVAIKALDVGFSEVLDRPFDPLNDWAYLGPALGVLSDSDGHATTVAAAVGAGLLLVATLAALIWAMLRLHRLARRHRRASVRAVIALATVWLVGAVSGLQVSPGVGIASSSTVGEAVDQVAQLRADLADRKVFARAIAHDAFGDRPADRLLAGLRGKDVLLVFVESYGRVAVEGSSFSPEVDAALDTGTDRLRRAGYSSRSAFLTSPTFGAASWLAHSTLQSGLWVDSQQRYDQLLGSDRSTLSDLFHRAGWRTVFDVPAVTRPWPEGAAFYHFDELYDATDVGYHGPSFSYATMPDQYTLAAFRRLELTRGHRPPVMAEIDLVSSHHPWTPLPQMVPWRDVGDGSVYDGMPDLGISPDAAFRDPDEVRALYGRSIVYSWQSLVSFLRRYADPNLVVVALGDHQPHSYVTGPHPGHDVPISVISQDPEVMRRTAGWGWQSGLRPRPDAPVWRMDAFRNAFLTAFDPAGTGASGADASDAGVGVERERQPARVLHQSR